MKIESIEQARKQADCAITTASHGNTELATTHLYELLDAVESLGWNLCIDAAQKQPWFACPSRRDADSEATR